MPDLKAVLKTAKKLLGEGQNEDALDAIQELLDNGIEDYMLFCFAALACANLDDATRAKHLYEKALKLDSKTPVAWQGLYKLYSSEKLALDDRSIETKKRRTIEDCRRRSYFELGYYDQLQKDLGTDAVLFGNIIGRLAAKEVFSPTETLLCNSVFNEVKDSLGTNPGWNLLYCQFLYK
ncbi:hypothetical protein KIN20_026131, partial [Parelaphostrongylus tenuis]